MSPAAPLSSTGNEDFLDWSADDTITAIRKRRITVRDYISGVLKQAERHRSLNAFITLLADDALSAADNLDDAIAKGEPLPPLAGLAIVAKDNINMRGLPTSAGTGALRTARPLTTAPSLQKLIDAGAIVIGKTNMHELAFGITGTNLSTFGGPVHNPYAPEKISGGSSSGTAVAIAARMVSCGLGTDTGGSSRVPAAVTGIVGMRPSVGNGGAERRYHDGHAVVPISRTRDTVCVMGRRVADVTLLDSIIAGHPRVYAASDIRGVRLGVPTCMWTGLDQKLEYVVLRARHVLEVAGAVFIEVGLPNLKTIEDAVSLPIAMHEPLADIPAYLEASGIEGVTLADIVRGIASPDVKGIFGVVMNDVYGGVYDEAMTVHRPALQRLYADQFEKHSLDALLFPTTILPAILIDEIHGSDTVSINGEPPVAMFGAFIKNTSPGSNAGIPGLSIPVGMTSEGLPVGLAIDGPIGSDEKLLSLGLAMERLFGCLPSPESLIAGDGLLS